MKLSLILIVLSVFSSTASVYSQNTRLSLKMENQKISEIFDAIEQQTEFYFFYNKNNFDENKRVSVDFRNMTIDEILRVLFKDESITYEIYDRNILIKSGPADTEEIILQQSIITGRVTDERGNLLPGVTIVVKGKTQGTVTDVNGNYSLSNVPPDAVLVFSFVGMKTQEIAVAGKTNINVTLTEESIGIDEVVAIGYGEQSRTRLTTSISKLDTRVLENASMSNVGSSLQGTIPGLRVINNTGQPGSLPSIILRGGASITNPGSPWVVVDGVVRELNDINQADIESIQVLKDAASTAVYGARSNNGVILIKTKRGKTGVSDFTYTLKSGVNIRGEAYNQVNARDYIYYNRLGVKYTNSARAQGGVAALNPDGMYGYGITRPYMYDIDKITSSNRLEFQSRLNNGWQWMIDPYTEKDTLIFKDYSGQVGDGVFNKQSYTQDHNLSFTGGNDKGKLAVTLGYYSEDGLAIGTKYERFSGTINGSYKVKKNLEILTGVVYSVSEKPDYLVGDLFFRAQSIQPTFKPFDAEGNPSSGFSNSYSNPLYFLDKYVRLNNSRSSIYNIGAHWEIIPDLFFKVQGNIYYTDVINESFNKKIVYQTGTVDVNRLSSASYAKSFQQQHNITLDYKKSFNQHNLSFLIGGEFFDLSSFNLSAAGKSAPTDNIYTLNSAVERTSISSTKSDYRMLSGFSRINYDYNGKYLLTAVIRYDGTSSLSDNRWGSFPGISAGWNMHKEDFFKASFLNSLFSVLKPRISYGVNGNIAGIDNYEVQGEYGIQTFYNAQAGYLNTGVINTGLRWEKSKSIDAGIELGMIDNKATLILTYFRRTTTDLLTNLALPDYTGFSSFRTNLGNLLNSGFESEFNVNIMRMDNGFSWDFGFNASYVKNKILKLPYNGNEKNRQGGFEIFDPKTGKVIWAGGYQEGGTMGNLYAFQQERILRDWDDVNQSAANRVDKIAEIYGPAVYAGLSNKLGKFPIEPGDVLWADLDKNDTIDLRDRVYMGNIYPKWTGGFSSTISYKNFSLYGRFDYALGHIIYNDLAAKIMGQNAGHTNLIDWIHESWTPDNPDTDLPKFYYADYPKLNIKRIQADQTGNNKSSRFYEKGDYLALREITISYLLPKSVISMMKISTVQTYITGKNLVYFTKYTGTSPEEGGIDPGRYPIPKTIIFGLKVSF